MRFTPIIFSALAIGVIKFVKAAPGANTANLQMARDSIPINDATVFRRDDDDRVMNARGSIVQEGLIPRGDGLYAELCDEDGNDCSGTYYLTNTVCWYRNGKKTLKIHVPPGTPEEHFILYTVASDGTCPGNKIDQQYFGVVHDGELIKINSDGVKFYFDQIYFGE